MTVPAGTDPRASIFAQGRFILRFLDDPILIRFQNSRFKIQSMENDGFGSPLESGIWNLESGIWNRYQAIESENGTVLDLRRQGLGRGATTVYNHGPEFPRIGSSATST
jgi:hypothetical protein